MVEAERKNIMENFMMWVCKCVCRKHSVQYCTAYYMTWLYFPCIAVASLQTYFNFQNDFLHSGKESKPSMWKMSCSSIVECMQNFDLIFFWKKNDISFRNASNDIKTHRSKKQNNGMPPSKAYLETICRIPVLFYFWGEIKTLYRHFFAGELLCCHIKLPGATHTA